MDTTIIGIARQLGYDVDALSVISQNVANMRTPGYRAERVTQDFGSAIPQARVALDTSDGALQQTGRSLDLALQGNGYFAVDVGGTPMLTRAGQFRVDADGRLVDAKGHVVLGEAGPIVVSASGARVMPDGEVRDGDRVVDRLRIVDVLQPGQLQEMDGGLYAYAGEVGAWTGAVHVGALEQANVDPGREMVRLMELTRHAQSLQHAMQAYDQALQTGITHLGENG